MISQALYSRWEGANVVGLLLGFRKQGITQARVGLLGLMGSEHDPLSTVINRDYLDPINAMLVKNLDLTPVFFKNADKVARLEPKAWSNMFAPLTECITKNDGHLEAANIYLNAEMKKLGIESYTLDGIVQETYDRIFAPSHRPSPSPYTPPSLPARG